MTMGLSQLPRKKIIILATQRYNLMVERNEWALETPKKPGAPASAPPPSTATTAAATAMSDEAILGRIESAVGAAARY